MSPKAIANVVGFLAFVVFGFAQLWLFRSTGAAAIEAVGKHPIKTGLVGVLSLIAAPLLVLFFTFDHSGRNPHGGPAAGSAAVGPRLWPDPGSRSGR